MASTIKGLTIEIGGDTGPLTKALSGVTGTAKSLQSELRQIDRLMKLDPKNTDLAAQKQKVLAESVENTKKKLETLKEAEKQVQAQFERGEIGEDQYRALQREVIKTEEDLKKLEKQFRDTADSSKAFSDKMETAGKKLQGIGGGMTDAGKNLSMKVTAPVVALGTAAVKSSIDFESAFAGVEKTVDATGQEFEMLEKGIRDMSKEIPTTATEIAGVAEAAGQLGIEVPNILDFTRVMSDLGAATNMSATDAATALARLANITQMPQTDFDRLGSVIVALGNNLATTESEIVDMGLRLAGAGKQVGMSEAEILSFAGALSSVGIESQAGGSAISKVMVDMQLAVEQGGERLTEFAAVAGMSSGEFQKAFRDDAAGAIISFISGLSTAEDRGMSAIKILDDMGITEVRLRDALLRAAGAGDLFNDAIDLGTEAWGENNALTKEAEQRYKTTESRLQIMRNRLVDVAIQFGDLLLPIVEKVVGVLSNLSERLDKLSPGAKQLIINVALIIAAVGPLLIFFGNTITAVGKFLPLLGKMAPLFAKLAPLIGKIGPLLKGVVPIVSLVVKAVGAFIGVLMSIPGWIFIVVAALIAAVILIYKNWDKLKEFFANLLEGIKTTFFNVCEAIKTFAINLWESVKTTFFNAINAIVEFFQNLPQTLAKFFLEDLPFMLGFALGTLVRWIIEAVLWFASLPGRIWEWLLATIQKVADWAVQMGQKALEAGQTFVANVIQFFKELPGKVWAWLVNTRANIIAWAGNIRQNAIAAGSNFLNNIISFFSQLPGRVWAYLSSTIAKFPGFVSGVYNNAVNAGRSMVNGFIGFIRDLPGKVWNVLVQTSSKLLNIGGTLYRNARKIAGNLWDGFKKGLGISSPSYLERAMDNIADRADLLKTEMSKSFGPSLTSNLKTAMADVGAAPALPAKTQETTGSQEIRHSGTIRVEGVNDQGQLSGVVDIVLEKLLQEVRA